MPTKKPRMGISLPPEVHKAYMELSEVSGMAASTFAAQVLSEALPMVRQLTAAFKVAQDSPAKAAAELENMMAAALVQTTQQSIDFQENIKPKLRKSPRKKDK